MITNTHNAIPKDIDIEATQRVQEEMKGFRMVKYFRLTVAEEDQEYWEKINKVIHARYLYSKHVEYLMEQRRKFKRSLWQIPLAIFGFIIFILAAFILFMPWDSYWELWRILFGS